MEQRAREMGKTSEAAVYRKFINTMKKKTKEMNEETNGKCKAGSYYCYTDKKCKPIPSFLHIEQTLICHQKDAFCNPLSS